MKKIVDGKEIDLTPEDIAEQAKLESEWVQEKLERDTREALKAAQFQRAVLLERALIAIVKERNGQANPPADVVEAAKVI